mgnify:CR=1 FL=1
MQICIIILQVQRDTSAKVTKHQHQKTKKKFIRQKYDTNNFLFDPFYLKTIPTTVDRGATSNSCS